MGFRLAEWVVKPEDGSLVSPTATNRLEPMLMKLLVFLCSRAGQVVTKQEVLDAVWQGRFVSDETVKSSFYQLRKVLGDHPREPRFIETLPKRGYRILVQPIPLEPDPDSASLYRKGREALTGLPSASSINQAKLYLERATQADPAHAEALSGLAHTYILIATYGVGRGSEFFPRAKTAALRAAELDPKLAEAHAALGIVRFILEHNFASAEQEFRLAIQLAPNEPLAHGWFAQFLASQNRLEEAVAEARRALEADRFSLPARRDLLEVLAMARRFDEALAEAHELFDIAPNSPEVHLGMVWFYYLQQRYEEAFEAFATGVKLLGVSPQMLEQARAAFEAHGMTAVLRLWLQIHEHEATLGQKNQNDRLVLYALLGERDRCFDLLEQALRDVNPFVFRLPVSPLFDSLRSDPRYAPFLARLGFSQPFPNP